MQDFSGSLLAEVSALRTQRPAFAPLFSNHQLIGTTSASATSSGSWVKVAPLSHSSKVSWKTHIPYILDYKATGYIRRPPIFEGKKFGFELLSLY